MKPMAGQRSMKHLCNWDRKGLDEMARIVVQVSRLDLDAGDLGRRQGLMPPDLHRAAAIRHPRTRAGFLAARHALRVQPAARLGCRPEDVPLHVDSRGKPHLAAAGAVHGAGV